MMVSAVGFLFETKTPSKGIFNKKNYTCVIHKENPFGTFNRSVIISPSQENAKIDIVSPETAFSDIKESLLAITSPNKKSKFIGATIKDGIKETEIHSVISDKLYAVRTKNEFGKNHSQLLGKEKTQSLLANNLYINA